MLRFALAALALLALAPVAQAQKAVAGEWITLGDVAPVTGEAADLLLGPAPPPGQTLALDPAFIVATAKGAGVMLAIPMDKPILVTRATGNATPAPVARAANTANPARQIAPTATSEGQVLILIRDVARGQVISGDDLEWADATSVRARGLSEWDAVAGMEARRGLKAGQHILINDIKAPAVIRKGDPVKLVYIATGVKLTVDGVAQNEAALGEAVRILNTYSKRTVDAVAAGHGEARIHTTGQIR
ncbi:MAG: flagellar basal body P-ring formation chaperone FlgA [Hyphomonadaceae bacterium]